MNWAHQTFEAEHWAIIIVGHGGKLNEISPDDHEATSHIRTWMGVDQFTEAVGNFNQATNGRVELLFFQNCNKATLEVVYEARNCARYTLASQLELGAPNYYYEGFLNRLREPSISGREAAIAIIDSERVDMYHTLTLLDNQAVQQIPEKLSRSLQPIQNSHLPMIKELECSTYRYFGEQYCDVLGLLGDLCRISAHNPSKLTEFTEFLRSSVISHYKTGGEFYNRRFLNNDANSQHLCGLGLYFPTTPQDISRYRSMALYQDVNLANLYGRMFKS